MTKSAITAMNQQSMFSQKIDTYEEVARQCPRDGRWTRFWNGFMYVGSRLQYCKSWENLVGLTFVRRKIDVYLFCWH